VCAAQRSRQRTLAVWNGNEVNVVRHETIAENPGAVVRCVSRQKIEIEAAIVGGAKHRFAIVSTLRDVVSDARKDDARATGHT
jgi:hypothetical protein